MRARTELSILKMTIQFERSF